MLFTYPATDDRVTIDGAQYLRHREGGALRPIRLPAQNLPQIPSPFMELMVSTSAGVRVRFRTAASDIVLNVRTAVVALGESAPLPAFVELLLDGQLTESRQVDAGTARFDFASNKLLFDYRPDVVQFTALPDHDKSVELWIPHTAVVDVLSVESNAPIYTAENDDRLRWIHHGSSISHCLEASKPTLTWPALAARQLDYSLTDLAFAGNAMLDQFVARTIRDSSGDFISLKLGINLVNANAMTLRSFVPAVDGFLDTIRDGHPDTPLLLISPIACAAVESEPGPTALDENGLVRSLATHPFSEEALTLGRIRTSLKAVVERRQLSDSNLHYLDGRKLFGDADEQAGLLPDGLHPNEQGYRLMADRFAQAVNEMRTLIRGSSGLPPHV